MITKKSEERSQIQFLWLAGWDVVNKLRVITGALAGCRATEVRGRSSHFTHTLKL